MKLLIINPGSTSTKLALYDGAEKLVQESLDHDAAELQQYHTIAEQVPMRLSVIRSFMERNGIDEKELAAVIECFLDTQSKENRVLFMRRYWYADSYADIGRLLGITESNARLRLMRMRKQLKTYLTEQEVMA